MKKKYKVTLFLKNVDDIYIRLIESTNKYPMGLNATLGIFRSEEHPNIEDFLADGFEVYQITIRRNKNA